MGNKRKSEQEVVPSEQKVPDEKNPFANLKELGQYSIERELGHGGMGYVFKAEDTRNGETVAIKILAPGFSVDESMVRRFKRETTILKSLHHPGIVRILDVDMEGEPKYYVMEFIPGRTLSDELKRGLPPVDEVLGIAWQVAEALSAAHEAGIIHRDIKPANIMRDETGKIKLTDFGIARVIGVAGGTAAGKFLGTPVYMSPEQVMGKDLGTVSDIYSFGVVLYEMLTGRAPFESANPLEVMRKHVYEEPVSPKELNSQVPAIVSQLVMRMLKKKREERISNPRVFESELQDCIRIMGGDLVTVTSRVKLEELREQAETKREITARIVKVSVFLCAIAGAILLILKPGGGLRGFARRYLAPTGGDRTIRESVSKIKNPFLRARASLNLLEKGDAQSFENLQLALESCSIPQKRKLLLMMGRKRIPETLLLIRGLQAEEELRASADEILIKFGNGFFSSLMQGEIEWFDKLDAAREFSEHWAFPLIEAGLKAEDAAVCVGAISVLEEKGKDVAGYIEGVVPSIVQVFEQGDEDEIGQLLEQLARVSCPEIRLLQKDVVSGKFKVDKSGRLLMAKAIALLGDSSGINMLRRNLRNADPYESILAYQGMLALKGNRVLSRMKRRLNSSDPLVRVLFASELVAMGDREGEAVLRKCLQDSNWQVRQAAIEGLVRNGEEKVLELLEQDLTCTKGTEGYPERIYGALEILGESGGSSMLNEFWVSCETEFVTACAKALSESAGEDSARTLAGIVSSKEQRSSDVAKLWAKTGLLRLISKWIE